MIAVIAGNYQQFRSWCWENCINPKRKDVVYVNAPSSLYGWHPDMVCYYGTYYNRSDIGEVEAIIRCSCPDLVDGRDL